MNKNIGSGANLEITNLEISRVFLLCGCSNYSNFFPFRIYFKVIEIKVGKNPEHKMTKK